MEKKKDYYKILGISEEEKKLSFAEFSKVLKSKYRKLCIQWHPDKFADKTEKEQKEAEEKFKDIAEAYDVLSDEKKKSSYDNPQVDFGGFGGFDPFADFDPFGFGFGRKHAKEPQVQQGGSIRIELGLTLEELYTGVEKKIKYKRYEPCHECGGNGLGKNGKLESCPICGGTGMEYSASGAIQMMRTCRRCNGTGKVITNPCKCCNGEGVEKKDHEMSFTIPKGMADDSELKIQGEGSLPPTKDGIPGDLYVHIVPKRHDIFVRRGNDLLFEFRIPICEALLGTKQNVSTIDGKVLETTIPQGVEENESIKFANKGMPVYGKEGRFGHMIGIVKLVLPKTLNEEEKRLIEELKEKEHFKQ